MTEKRMLYELETLCMRMEKIADTCRIHRGEVLHDQDGTIDFALEQDFEYCLQKAKALRDSLCHVQNYSLPAIVEFKDLSNTCLSIVSVIEKSRELYTKRRAK